MRKAAQMAWGAMAALAAIAAILVIAAFYYHVTAFWAGAMLAAGQAFVMGLAAWGLSLGLQAKELDEHAHDPRGAAIAGNSLTRSGQAPGSFRMSMGGDESVEHADARAEGTKVLDTGFQRLLTFFAGSVLALFSALTLGLIYYVYSWSQAFPELKVPIAGTLAQAKDGKLPPFDELALLVGLAACAAYVALYWFTRPSRSTGIHGEAGASNFTLGLSGMIALGVAAVLAYFKVIWASEIAAAVIAAFMLLQGLELIVNAFRSYSSIEELDQDAVDLQATPLVPMLGSIWLGGLRMLLAQSVGLHGGGGGGKRGEPTVIARMMPRVLLALVVMGIAASCFRVVPPGQVAILERLGYTPTEGPDDPRPLPGAILQSGLHVTMPWPIDQLVYLPTQELQVATVGTELHAPGEWKKVDFQFWQVRPATSGAEEWNDLFNTGEAGSPQFLETYIQVRWRVADPSRFYAAMSHNEMFDKTGGSADAPAMPIYEAMVKQATAEAVTKTFAIHSLEQIMLSDRQEVELHCRAILQQRLDELCALPDDKPGEKHRGIDIAYLTIKDLHPPKGPSDKQDSSRPVIGGALVETDKGYDVVSNPAQPSTIARGPASAFEFVVSMREFAQEIINTANAQAIKAKNDAHGQAQSAIADARTYSAQKIAQARGDADRFVEMTRGMSPEDVELMKRRLLVNTARSLLDPVTKIVADPSVSDIQIIQGTGNNASGPLRPPGN